MKKEIDGLNRNRMRSYRNDVSGALALGRQMLGTYFDGREGDVPSALILITDEPSNENVNLIVSKILQSFINFEYSWHLMFLEAR
jgi:hypothetical protein